MPATYDYTIMKGEMCHGHLPPSSNIYTCKYFLHYLFIYKSHTTQRGDMSKVNYSIYKLRIVCFTYNDIYTLSRPFEHKIDKQKKILVYLP